MGCNAALHIVCVSQSGALDYYKTTVRNLCYSIVHFCV